jgi:hypothetical protein
MGNDDEAVLLRSSARSAAPQRRELDDFRTPLNPESRLQLKCQKYYLRRNIKFIADRRNRFTCIQSEYIIISMVNGRFTSYNDHPNHLP